VEKRTYEKKEFAPWLTFILFEEPEAFLHHGQKELLSTFSVTLTTRALNQSRLRRFTANPFENPGLLGLNGHYALYERPGQNSPELSLGILKTILATKHINCYSIIVKCVH
jgi:hypothetical protein